MISSLQIRICRSLFLCVPAALFLVLTQDVARAEKQISNYFGGSLFVEEDALYPPLNEDRNYTGGFGAQITGPFLHRHRLDGPVVLFDRLTRASRLHREGRQHLYAVTLVGTAFTPDSLNTSDPIFDDRPYASILGLAFQRQSVDDNVGKAWTTELTIGALGLDVSGDIQKAIHRASRRSTGRPTPFKPLGWPNQISSGGEPTLLYRTIWTRLLAENDFGQSGAHWLQASSNLELSAGYYTNAAAGLALRLGCFSNGFWQLPSNPMNGSNQAATTEEAAGRPDLFLFGAIRPRFILYNALLQGQFRESKVTIPTSALRRNVNEFEAGITLGIPLHYPRGDNPRTNKLALTWVYIAGRTPEFGGARERTHVWGSVFASLQLAPRSI